MKPTNVPQLIAELGSGNLEAKLSLIISNVAMAVLETSKAGEVSIKLKLKTAGSNTQLDVEHTLAYSQPKSRGTIKEDDSQNSIMYVNEGGNLSQFPENQVDAFGLNQQEDGVVE